MGIPVREMWNASASVPVERADAVTVHADGDAIWILLSRRQGEPVLQGPFRAGVAPCAVAAADVDASLEQATGLGATTITEPMDIPTVGRMAIIADPTGAVVGLYKAES